MKKSWLYGTIAGIALMVTACGPNTAADNRDYAARSLYQDNVTTRGTDMTYRGGLVNGTNGTLFDGTLTGTRGVSPFGTDGLNGDNLGMRAGDRTNNSLYRPMGATIRGANNYANHVGFVRVNRNTLQTNNAGNNIYVDRDALARIVGNVTASVPGVATSTVLVTDEEIFVGLNTDGNNAAAAKEKARMNAQSVSPRYFRVYVTDNQSMINEMGRVASRTGNALGVGPANNNDQQIDRLIKSFGGVTDGEDMRGRRTTTGATTGITNTIGTMTAPGAAATSTGPTNTTTGASSYGSTTQR